MIETWYFSLLFSSFLQEIPNEPVTVFQDGRVKVELIFHAEVSNVLIVNARALGEDDLDLTVTFHMSDVSEIPCHVWSENILPLRRVCMGLNW